MTASRVDEPPPGQVLGAIPQRVTNLLHHALADRVGGARGGARDGLLHLN